MKSVPRCPKCRSFPNEYMEVWTKHGLSFDADDTGKPSEEGYCSTGRPDYVIASCRKCGHAWRLKGVTQITEIKALFEGK